MDGVGLSGLSNVINKSWVLLRCCQRMMRMVVNVKSNNLVSAENTAFNDANYKNDKSNENLFFLKGRKSI